jgi:hypothetical protein
MADCARPVLAHQRRDEATIQRLENAWSIAFLTGDTELEACLLTPDFTAIMSTGNVMHLNEELALAAKNRGKTADPSSLTPVQVHLHGDVAVGYGITTKLVSGQQEKSYFADYYVWEKGGWRVYFAQQTAFKP